MGESKKAKGRSIEIVKGSGFSQELKSSFILTERRGGAITHLSRRDKTRVARLRKAYVAAAESGCANLWLSGAP
jgi:hypothetical protein